MSGVTDLLADIWNTRTGPAVLTTVDTKGIPNSIYVTCCKRYSDDTILVADNFFSKTRANLQKGQAFSLLFMTGEKSSVQCKGDASYETDGERKQFMRECLDPKYPVHAVAILKVREIYKGSERLA